MKFPRASKKQDAEAPVRAAADDAPEPKGPDTKTPAKPGDKAATGTGPSRGLFGFVMLLVLVVMLVMFFSSAGGGQKMSYAEFEQNFKNNYIDTTSIELHEDGIHATMQQDPGADPITVRVPINTANKEDIARQLGVLTGGAYTAKPASGFAPFLILVLPLFIFIILIWFLISRGLRSAGAGAGMLGSFGKSRHRTLTKEMTGVTFKDVAGIEEAKDEVGEIIEFLKHPKRFTRLGGRIPRGVLLTGPPGCGKTLLAKAIAGEADVPFFSISGSDFVEMFVGVGASRVRDLFKQAKDSAPCIIFLDEIDAVGRRRGGGFSTGGHDEREQTLNAILVEMDGFAAADGVIVIAATNRPDVLDPALIRPGRFDRQIAVPFPDVKGRLEILKVHAKKVKLGPNVDMEKIARGTPMFAGADLAAIINEGAIAATLQNKDFIEHEDLEEARDKVKFGRAKKSRVREKDENKLVAYHEAGHAVLQALLRDSDPLHKVTIIPRGDTGGATFSLPEKDRMGYALKWLNATMRVLCGGRIAEQRAMEDASSGAAQDISQVTQLARTMILEWGMSEKLGFIRYAPMDTREMYVPERDYSEDTARLIDQEIRRLVDEAYADADKMLDDNWAKVVDVAEALLKYETLTADEVHKLIRGEPMAKPTVAELLAADRPPPSAKPPPKGAEDAEPDMPPGTLPSPA